MLAILIPQNVKCFLTSRHMMHACIPCESLHVNPQHSLEANRTVKVAVNLFKLSSNDVGCISEKGQKIKRVHCVVFHILPVSRSVLFPNIPHLIWKTSTNFSRHCHTTCVGIERYPMDCIFGLFIHLPFLFPYGTPMWHLFRIFRYNLPIHVNHS